MSDHHDLDLDAIKAKLDGHSIFAPSSSSMWLLCSGSLIPHLLAPDNAGFEAAEGTVGHTVGEIWLNRIKGEWEIGEEYDTPDMIVDACEPSELIGTTATIHAKGQDFDIEITDEMLSYVREYVMWCIAERGEHYIETRVDFSQITPIPDQGGTADHACCTTGKLTITDLKYGAGIQVYAEENTQAMLYALGFFFKYDAIYHFEEIVIRIAQPRKEHFDVWETTRERLLEFAEWAGIRAKAAWQKDAPRTPGEKQCQWCRVSDTCAARLAMFDDVFEDYTDGGDVIEGTYTVAEMQKSGERLMSGALTMALPDSGALSTAQMAKLLPYRKMIEKWFASMAEELEYRAKNGEEVPGYKVVVGREGDRAWEDEKTVAAELEFLGVPPESIFVSKLQSPAQIGEVLHKTYRMPRKKADAFISHLVTREPGREVLAPLSDKREALEDFEGFVQDYSDDDL